MDTASQIEKYDPGITTPPEIFPPDRLLPIEAILNIQFGRCRNITPVDKPKSDVVE
jgi:hypothetical protein